MSKFNLVAIAVLMSGMLACSPAEQRDTRDEVGTAGTDTETRVTDGAITAAVEANLLAEPTISETQIDVDTRDGVVTLTGAVANPAVKTRAADLARSTTGVVRVEDKLTVTQ